MDDAVQREGLDMRATEDIPELFDNERARSKRCLNLEEQEKQMS